MEEMTTSGIAVLVASSTAPMVCTAGAMAVSAASKVRAAVAGGSPERARNSSRPADAIRVAES